MARKKRKRPFIARQEVFPPRTWLLTRLHRSPCRWDVLIGELSERLLDVYHQESRRLAASTLRFGAEDLVAMVWMLARGFETFIVQTHLLHPPPPGDLWHLDQPGAARLAEQATTQCFEPLLRKYVEDVQDLIPGRPHADLDLIVGAFREDLQHFLAGRCLLGGDLRDCLTSPLADPGGYFPRMVSTGSVALPLTTGEPLQDIHNLGYAIHDDDDPTRIKQTLVRFVRQDPWLFRECQHFVQERAADRDDQDDMDPMAAADDATDEFIYRATHLAGRTPIELLIDRQYQLSPRQRNRLLRWDREQFTGIFLVKAVRLPLIDVRDLELGRDMALEATKPEMLRVLKQGQLLISRVVPWDDHWLLSGMQRLAGRPSAQDLARIEAEAAQRLSLYRLPDDDPRVRQAFEVQQEQHVAWLNLFGVDEMLFKSGADLRAAVDRFEHYWGFEAILPESGLTRAQDFERRRGRQPPEVKLPLPDKLLKAKDLGVIFHPVFGMTFLTSYGTFRSAFESQGSLSFKQAQVAWLYLTDESIDFWVFEQMKERYPARTQEVFRQILKDQQFQLERDFGPTLRKFKGQQMRRPPRPTVRVLDDTGVEKML